MKDLGSDFDHVAGVVRNLNCWDNGLGLHNVLSAWQHWIITTYTHYISMVDMHYISMVDMHTMTYTTILVLLPHYILVHVLLIHHITYMLVFSMEEYIQCTDKQLPQEHKDKPTHRLGHAHNPLLNYLASGCPFLACAPFCPRLHC